MLGRNIFYFTNVSYTHVYIVGHKKFMLLQNKLGYTRIPEEDK
jgi:hypothetical protein